jgi:hypothetical protein
MITDINSKATRASFNVLVMLLRLITGARGLVAAYAAYRLAERLESRDIR